MPTPAPRYINRLDRYLGVNLAQFHTYLVGKQTGGDFMYKWQKLTQNMERDIADALMIADIKRGGKTEYDGIFRSLISMNVQLEAFIGARNSDR